MNFSGQVVGWIVFFLLGVEVGFWDFERIKDPINSKCILGGLMYIQLSAGLRIPV